MTDDEMLIQWIRDLQSWLSERYMEDDEKYEQFERCFKRLLKEDISNLK